MKRIAEFLRNVGAAIVILPFLPFLLPCLVYVGVLVAVIWISGRKEAT